MPPLEEIPEGGSGSAPTATPKVYYARLSVFDAPIAVTPGTPVDVVTKTFIVPADGDYYVLGTASFQGDPTGVGSTPNAYVTCEFDLIADGATVLDSGVGTSVWLVTQLEPFNIRFFFDSVAVQGAIHLTAGSHTLVLEASVQGLPGAIGALVEFAQLSIQPVTSLDAVPT
jgi:hypothetical protein